MIRENAIKKGDVLAVARIAAIQAVKKTSDFIPLAHGGVPVEGCVVRVEPVGLLSKSDTKYQSPASSWEEQSIEEISRLAEPIGMYGGVRISVRVETTAKTGVEMEALTGVMGAALTVVDMCKGVDKGCVIEEVKVIGKKGGRSGGLGIWREGPGERAQGAKELVGDVKSTETEGGMVQGSSTQLIEEVFKQRESERAKKATNWKKWTRDLEPA